MRLPYSLKPQTVYLSHAEHTVNARLLYVKYREAQGKVDAFEEAEIERCMGNKQLAMVNLTVADAALKQKYKLLTSDRDGLMNQLIVEISMSSLNKEA